MIVRADGTLLTLLTAFVMRAFSESYGQDRTNPFHLNKRLFMMKTLTHML